MIYIILLILFLGFELVYFKIADHFNIIDKPNSRSSHTSITLRGGGIIFPAAILAACLLGHVSWMVTFAVVLVAIVSFIDDIKPLSQLPRFISHTIAIILIFYDLGLFMQAIWILPVIYFLMIGWVNVFNFMDGINGITVLYSFTAILSFAFLDINKDSLPLLIIMALSCGVFGIFNVRKKAKTFAGDVGSISMAMFLGFFMVKTILATGQIGYLLFLSIYGIDAGITIFARIKKKENIFEPHRSHLYQYLANELGYSHIKVSVLYAGIQLLFNILILFLQKAGELSLPIILSFLAFQILTYLWIRIRVIQKINSAKIS
ncbi:MraY family glycosyltransferase [Flavobacterium aquicola]|uniref:UDP-N-acetylmuramyl pentapeptide phosphotransferase/UDP-N-acetylglucosamine-1-phosphate transferase n=1 Tax=Flavobacterium aquicola TaxID=1682742 RepID=A0A3E0EJB8_9FLAO|nr:glycosyltransferase family 4 protein [Flavobacterium aquicola]REG98255.1 UDP-N-acetylmuramyl pentapeptide phosphotransferase/UDP-N-acetylglucosamine-1-phosphate transferase [Flavobacterium aquicola]